MYKWYKFPEDINKVSSLGGVYLLSETPSVNGIIYIGKTDDLRKRLSQHPDPNNPCLQKRKINYFAYEITLNFEEREAELIKKYDPPCNRQ